jgi:hypothetical protein
LLIFAVNGDLIAETFPDPVIEIVCGHTNSLWKSDRHRQAVGRLCLPAAVYPNAFHPLMAIRAAAPRLPKPVLMSRVAAFLINFSMLGTQQEEGHATAIGGMVSRP